MNTRKKLAAALRKAANKIDPPEETPEGPEPQVPEQPANIYALDGFGLPAPIARDPDWTWTQGSPGGVGNIRE